MMELERRGSAALPERQVIMPARKREIIEPHEGDRRYVRRDDRGRVTDDQVDVGRPLSQDNNQQAKRSVPSRRGDKDDHRKT